MRPERCRSGQRDGRPPPIRLAERGPGILGLREKLSPLTPPKGLGTGLGLRSSTASSRPPRLIRVEDNCQGRVHGEAPQRGTPSREAGSPPRHPGGAPLPRAQGLSRDSAERKYSPHSRRRRRGRPEDKGLAAFEHDGHPALPGFTLLAEETFMTSSPEVRPQRPGPEDTPL